jgi:hypothetical protein
METQVGCFAMLRQSNLVHYPISLAEKCSAVHWSSIIDSPAALLCRKLRIDKSEKYGKRNTIQHYNHWAMTHNILKDKSWA